MKQQPKDYCTASPEEVHDVKIGESCCKKHDNEVGCRGTYNPITPHVNFYNCLYGKFREHLKTVKVTRKKVATAFLGYCTVVVYTAGGTLFSWIKYPYFAYRIYRYRKGK